jgi:hypothetical protein
MFDRSHVSNLLNSTSASLPPPISTSAAPPLPMVSATTYYPASQMALLNSSATIVPSTLINTFFSLHPVQLSAFNVHHSKRQIANQQSQAAQAVARAVPRQEKTANRGFKKQTAAVLLGAGDGKSKAWGMGMGSKLVKFFVFALRARIDLAKLFEVILREDYSSQLCPKCRWP